MKSPRLLNVGRFSRYLAIAILTVATSDRAGATAADAKPFNVDDNDELLSITTPALQATIRKRGYVSGVAANSLVDRKTGARDVGFGLDIVDWIMEPGSDEAYRDRLPDHMVYQFNTSYHGKTAKRSIEGPQICTKAGELSPRAIQGADFVAVQQSYQYTLAAPEHRTGSTWSQTIVFPKDARYFVSADRIDAVNSSEAMFLRIDLPGHIKHKQGDTFSEVYLSYATNPPEASIADRIRPHVTPTDDGGQRIASAAFLENFAPDEAFNYRRDANGSNSPSHRFIRAYHLRDPATGKEGPWLAGMTLDPGVVCEAWCHQRGYVCMIEEFGGRPVKAGESFGAAFIVGFFDSIDEMHRIYDQHRGHTGLVVDSTGWKLIR